MATEGQKWNSWEWPYDNATCRNCASFHDQFDCADPEHVEMVKAAKKMGLRKLLESGDDKKIRRAFLSFRKKFARFYPSGKGAK